MVLDPLWYVNQMGQGCGGGSSDYLDVDTVSFLWDLVDFFLVLVMTLMYFVHVYLVFCNYSPPPEALVSLWELCSREW